MTDYQDLKVAPVVHSVLADAAERQYDDGWGSIGRAAHEAVIAWLVLRADDDVVDDTLAAHDFDDIQDLIDHLATDEPGADGRYANDPLFDPLAAVRTPRDLDAHEQPEADD